MIINAENMILGRLASFAAKKALLGEEIKIVNCEKAAITGNKNTTFKSYKRKLELGQPPKGPFIQRRPDKLVRRTIRGMLPYKQEKGRMAFKRITCHLGVPEGISKEKMTTVGNANISKVPNLKYTTVAELSKQMRGK